MKSIIIKIIDPEKEALILDILEVFQKHGMIKIEEIKEVEIAVPKKTRQVRTLK